jgi:hypothetical protein
MDKDMYTCAYCGTEIDWEEADDVHGSIFYCGNCNEMFCEKCFFDRFGQEAFRDMFCFSDLVLYPDCYAKHKRISLKHKNKR